MMASESAETGLRGLLARAGVCVGGGRPWDIRVSDPALFPRVMSGGSRALMDAYADGWWEADRLDELFHRLHRAGTLERLAPRPWARLRLFAARLRAAAAEDGLGADLFRAMLGRRMSQSCAYWKEARTLDEAEDAGLGLVCRRLELKRGMSVLDFGCGWGAFARYAAERHGVSVTGVDICEARIRHGREACKGLPVALRVQDYKEVRGRFDRVVSIGLMDRVPPAEARAHMSAAARCLKADGIALLHAAGPDEGGGRPDGGPGSSVVPGGEGPSFARMALAMEGLFTMEDVHNLGPHYDPTLLAWHENLARRWPELRARYGDRLYRTLKYRLLYAAGRFRARRGQLYQFVLTRGARVQPRGLAEPAPAREAPFVGA